MFNPFDDNKFATAGKDHMAICVYDGKKSIKIQKGKGKVESQCSAAWIN